MNIYDCFMYYDEDLLLDIRLNTLNKYVKKFVITEAVYTHNGAKKKLNFDYKNFGKFKDKIDYIIVDKEPPNILQKKETDTKERKDEKLILNGMARDNFQRENLKRGLSDISDEDLILISDLDEIPNLDVLHSNYVDKNIIIFEQKMFYYKFNLLFNNFKWFGTKGTKKKNFISPQWIRNIKNKIYPFWRLDTMFSKKKYSNVSIIKNGGWHFTCIRSPKDLERKMLNFAHHYEFEQSGLKLNDLKNLMKNKIIMYKHNVDQKEDKWSGGSKLEKIDVSILPDYIKSNLNKFNDWLD